ncbi:MAG: GNAT family N-acetyltransferase [Methanomassiliicoccales archaeon]|nr:GNAT family N-acetyltransferase [Methanomassiliicoccales archaeon]MDD1755211.1 GNAT family N-acetyltransferase [Methanomassiliicoccales archaeon]
MAEPAKPLKGLLVRPMSHEDIATCQEVGSQAWSDLASRELGRKVKYPVRPRRIIEAYLWKEPEGCLVAEHEGRVVGVAYSHVWGKVGWFGPFEVLPEMQDKGIGTALLVGCERFLERRGCKVLGLETMSNNPKNLHFYMRGGYRILGSSLIMEKELRSGAGASSCEPSNPEEVIASIGDISALSRKGHPLLDYSRETEMAARHDLGAVLLARKGSRLRGVAVVHSYYAPNESDHASLRLVLVDPRAKDQEDCFNGLRKGCESWSFGRGRKRLFVRFPGENLELYRSFLSSGYNLAAANLRLVRGIPFSERGRYHLAAWAG